MKLTLPTSLLLLALESVGAFLTQSPRIISIGRSSFLTSAPDSRVKFSVISPYVSAPNDTSSNVKNSPVQGRTSVGISSTFSLDGEAAEILGETLSNIGLNFDKATKNETYDMVCRVVANGDGKLPTCKSVLPKSLLEYNLLEKLDYIYHALSHSETSHMKYVDKDSYGHVTNGEKYDNYQYNEIEEKKLVAVIRSSLEGAGFELLNRRDLDLCEALNAGYLLRLSILPDTEMLDPIVGKEFYPDHMPAECLHTDNDDQDEKQGDNLKEPLLFDGCVLVFRRGYSAEVTKGRLLLPKLDYLQASVVQRSSSSVTNKVAAIERWLFSKLSMKTKEIQDSLNSFAQKMSFQTGMEFIRSKWLNETDESDDTGDSQDQKRRSFIKLERYGGRKTKFVGEPDINDALQPFLLCLKESKSYTKEKPYFLRVSKSDNLIKGDANVTSSNRDEDESSNSVVNLYAGLDTRKIFCKYDDEDDMHSTKPVKVIDRVSISNLVDFFSVGGRRRLVRSFLSKSELVEPTYEEVVVVWRPLPEKKKKPRFDPKPVISRFIYDIAELLDAEDRVPQPPERHPKPKRLPLEIRVFNNVPMANLPAVLPRTRLVFRPADAFVFDLISVFSLLAVLATQRYDNPKLDIIALVSVCLWLLRTVIRYSNKLARYDLLVKNFLTSKIAQRGEGAVKYIATEAGSQRAIRAGLVHTWILNLKKDLTVEEGGEEISGVLTRDHLMKAGNAGVNNLVNDDESVNIDVSAAIDDLNDLNLIELSQDGESIKEIKEGPIAIDALKRKWIGLFDDRNNRKPGTKSNKSASDRLDETKQKNDVDFI